MAKCGKKQAQQEEAEEIPNPEPHASEDEDESDHDSDDDDDDDDDEDDDELIAAAAAWANQTDATKKPSDDHKDLSSSNPSLDNGNKKLSLHITQLPYDTNELDLRRLFAEQGCRMTSIRLVFDHDEKGRKTVFRGVAFVDLLDNESYDKALAMNRKTSIRGRKLNIRPTRSKQELADIVIRTKELVQEKIKEQLGHQDGDTSVSKEGTGGPFVLDKKARNKQKKKEKKEKAKAAKAKPNNKNAKHKTVTKVDGAKREGTKKEGTKKERSTPKEEGKPGKEVKKLTKKERNRRAAILMSIRKKK